MALCTICGVSDAGIGGVPLVQIDGRHYCRRCLSKTKGSVRCSVCHELAGETNDALTSLPDGQYICDSCLERAAGTGAASEAVAALLQQADDPVWYVDLPIEPLTGGLKRAYDESVPRTEKVMFVLAASAGEALVATERRAIVLKAGYAAGAPSATKARSFTYDTISAIDLSAGPVQGRLQLIAPGIRPVSASVGDVYQAENIITFSSDQRPKYDKAARALQRLISRSHR